jgi:hypothetical protein
MIIEIFFITSIILIIVYYTYTNFVSVLLQKLDLKIENFCVSRNFLFLNRNIELLFVYNVVKFTLFFFSLFLFCCCTWMYTLHLYKLNSHQLFQAFFITITLYLSMLSILFKICLDVFSKKKVNLHEIGMVVLLSYSAVLLSLVTEELRNVPFPNVV